MWSLACKWNTEAKTGRTNLGRIVCQQRKQHTTTTTEERKPLGRYATRYSRNGELELFKVSDWTMWICFLTNHKSGNWDGNESPTVYVCCIQVKQTAAAYIIVTYKSILTSKTRVHFKRLSG